MPFPMTCPHCKTMNTVTEEHRGKQARCYRCQKTFPVPIPEPSLSNAVSAGNPPAQPPGPSFDPSRISGLVSTRPLTALVVIAAQAALILFLLLVIVALIFARANRLPSRDDRAKSNGTGDLLANKSPGRVPPVQEKEKPPAKKIEGPDPKVEQPKQKELPQPDLPAGIFNLENIKPNEIGRFPETHGSFLHIYRVVKVIDKKSMVVTWTEDGGPYTWVLIKGLGTDFLADRQILEGFHEHTFQFVGSEKVGKTTLRVFTLQK